MNARAWGGGMDVMLLLALISGVMGLAVAVVALRVALAAMRRAAALETELHSRPALAGGQPPSDRWPAIPGATYDSGRRDISIDAATRLRSLRDGGQEILAIKETRELTGMGLREARDFVKRL